MKWTKESVRRAFLSARQCTLKMLKKERSKIQHRWDYYEVSKNKGKTDGKEV